MTQIPTQQLGQKYMQQEQPMEKKVEAEAEGGNTEKPGTASLLILRLPDVCLITGLARSTIYRMESDRRFPERIKIGARAVGWIKTEVDDWLVGRIDISRARTPDSRE